MSISLELSNDNQYRLPTLPSIHTSSTKFKPYEPGFNKNLRYSQLYVPIVKYDAHRSRSS